MINTSYKINFLSAKEGIGKKTGNPYYMMNLLFTVYENGVVMQSYTANVFLNEEQFALTKDYTPMQALDMVFLPTSRGIQIISMDIAE